MLYGYEVNKQYLTDVELECLGDEIEVFSFYSPREIKEYAFFDCIFPNGDVFVKTKEAVEPASAVAYY